MEPEMKTFFLCAGIILTILVLTTSVKAETNIGGYINTDNRLRPKGDDQYTWNENRLGLKVTASADGVSGFSELRFRNFGFPDIQQTDRLRDSDYIQPLRLELYEAYVDIYGLFLENLDIRVGKQRIAWGTADKLNVVDNLNPDDFEDILNFSQKIPTMSLRFDYYPGDFIVTGVIVPVFTPARSLPSNWQAPVSFTLPPELNLRTLDDEVILPKNRPQDSAILGLRIKRTLLDYDWSLSYVYGRDEWALLTKADIITIDTLGTTDVHLTLEYPRHQIVGADMAGTIGDIGIWAECAMFLPEKKIYTIITSPNETQEQLVLDDKPYFKYVVGGDYTFKNGIYINGQYLHGFYTDRGVDNIEDYFLIALEKKFFHEDLKTRMVIAAEVANFDDIENRSAYFGGPELTYYPKDNIELITGSFLLAGDSSTQFGQFKENDEIYFKVKYSF
ncbi:MAG: hypothetical protein B6D58_01230 [candidate division Zixibacteria bacterium 4484_95]|nr:MAG: hypothetical protein B6D58_01230 [candidate division Zixibacteria bacterium 4484_95]